MTAKEQSLPNAKVGQITHLIETLDILGGQSDIEGLAIALKIAKGSIHNTLNATLLLNLTSTNESKVKLTQNGRDFSASDVSERRKIFKKALIEVEPFATLNRAFGRRQRIEKDTVIGLVKSKIEAARSWKESTMEEMFRVVVNWAKYAELFTYDKESNAICASRVGETG